MPATASPCQLYHGVGQRPCRTCRAGVPQLPTARDLPNRLASTDSDHTQLHVWPEAANTFKRVDWCHRTCFNTFMHAGIECIDDGGSLGALRGAHVSIPFIAGH